jgi:alkanesulfonate monooxygenase SsuD/methylene tetrahydromethanopterin reductase-like flavin-dependent oxidoreductase (luciferase family)
MTRSRPVVGLMLSTVANLDTGKLEPDRVVEAAHLAEAAGFDGVYVGDHVLHPHPIMESIVTLSVVAASTKRISFGPCVMLFALRQPLVLAKQLATLSAFAPGRLRVGVGVGGEYPAEFDALGVPLSERGRRMESALSQVRSLLSGEAGRAGASISPTVCDIPFLLAGWKETSLRRAARLGDGWIGYLLGLDSFSRRRAFLLQCLEELGRGIEGFTTGMLLPVHLDPSGREGRAAAAEAWTRLTTAPASLPERLFVAGRPTSVIEQLERYWDAGCTEFMLAPADQGDRYLDQVHQLGQHVLPALKGFM